MIILPPGLSDQMVAHWTRETGGQAAHVMKRHETINYPRVRWAVIAPAGHNL